MVVVVDTGPLCTIYNVNGKIVRLLALPDYLALTLEDGSSMRRFPTSETFSRANWVGDHFASQAKINDVYQGPRAEDLPNRNDIINYINEVMNAEEELTEGYLVPVLR